MSTTISRGFIRARYLAALALIGVLAAGGVLFAERAARDFNRLAEAYARAESLNRDVLSAMTAISNRVVGYGYRRDIADRALLGRIVALEHAGSAFGADLQALEPDFARFFLARERGGRDFAVFVTLARGLAEPMPLADDVVDRRYTQLLRVSETLVQPFFATLAADLAARHAAVWEALLTQLVGVALAVFAALAGAGLFIFLPLERRMLSTQDALARETVRAQEAERGKGAFLANMSHEIRTCLAGVIGMTELLGRTRLDAEQGRYVEIMRASGKALLRIINDILDFTKVAAGEMPLDTAPFDPARVLVDAAQLFAPVAKAKGLDFVLDIDPATPRAALGDGLRIAQVATNLMHNAVKFTAEGRIVLATTWRADLGLLRVSVCDTGVGIAPGEIDAVFEKFRQVDNTATHRSAGTGLGLALAKSLVEQMGGRIGVESAPGKGSTFAFDVPLHCPPGSAAFGRPGDGLEVTVRIVEPLLALTVRRALIAWGCDIVEGGAAAVVIVDMTGMGADRSLALARLRADHPGARLIALTREAWGGEDADEALTTPVDPDALLAALRPRAARSDRAAAPLRLAARRGAQRLRVLVAEDNEVNRLIASKLLDGLGCAVELAEDGVEAVRRATEARPDLILMDVSMPRMSGLEAAAEIRRREAGAGRRTPIVALTAHAMAEHRDRCLAAGMDDHLAKPFSAEGLAEKVARWGPSPVPAPTAAVGA
jgi:signal transduction histidine kinase/CheY-like chemotaxis protein